MKNFLWLLLAILIVSSCHKEEKITTAPGAYLEFSTDTIYFDTLFTSVGSVTKRLKVYNRNSKAVNISSIELGGKATGSYQLIIDGQETWYRNNLYLRGGDSVYVLVKVLISNPKDPALPFIVPDSIVFNTNGNIQQVQLLAYGQDATFLRAYTIPCDTIWKGEKPFVVYDHLRVSPGCTLTIEKGAKIYFHYKARFKVEGTLIVKGTQDSLVRFTGDNLGESYKELGGQWDGIVFESSSQNNVFNFAVIQNAVTGVSISSNTSDTDTIPEVIFSNTIIKNMQKTGVDARGADIYAVNSVFTNAVRPSFAGSGGGNYHFVHCTFANYSYAFFREGLALEFSNSSFTEISMLEGDLKARLTNCIVWGDYPNELLLYAKAGKVFDFSASHCILKTTRDDLNINGNLINTDPLFQQPVRLDYHLKDLSPAINAGKNAGIAADVEGKARNASPDIGAFEK